MGGGVTLDMGIYPIQLTSLVMGGEKPLKVIAGGHLNEHVSITIVDVFKYSTMFEHP